MAINDFSDAEIREYLLGQAGPEMTEQLDEHSFTDEFAERIGTVEHDLIDEYLAGSLSRGETRAFESHYLSSPLRREKVEFARAFAKYAERSHPIMAPEREPGGLFWDGLRNWRMAFQFGMAAAGLLLVAIFGLLIYRSSLQSGDAGTAIATNLGSPTPANSVIGLPTPGPTVSPEPAAIASASAPERTNSTRPADIRPQPTPGQQKRPQPSLAIFTLTPALRSTSFQTVKSPAGPAEFRLRLESESNGPFTAEVVELRGQGRVWAARSMAASGSDDNRIVSFRVPAGTIRPGEHRVTVFARGPGGQQEKVGDYFFRVAP